MSYKLARARARDLGLAVGMGEEEKQAKRTEIETECRPKINAAYVEADKANAARDVAVLAAYAERDRKLAALEAGDADDKS